MNDIKVEYLGHVIVYYEITNSWMWDGNDFKSLSDAKKAIDFMLAQSRKCNIKAILVINRYRDSYEIEVVTITSFVAGGLHAWVSNKDKRRSKESLTDLIEDTQENRKEMVKFIDATEAIRKSREAAKAILDAIPRVKPGI